MITQGQRAGVEKLIREAGYAGPLMVAKVGSDDERIFVLPDGVIDTMSDQQVLEAALQRELGRKVWIVSASSGWTKTEPF